MAKPGMHSRNVPNAPSLPFLPAQVEGQFTATRIGASRLDRSTTPSRARTTRTFSRSNPSRSTPGALGLEVWWRVPVARYLFVTVTVTVEFVLGYSGWSVQAVKSGPQ